MMRISCYNVSCLSGSTPTSCRYPCLLWWHLWRLWRWATASTKIRTTIWFMLLMSPRPHTIWCSTLALWWVGEEVSFQTSHGQVWFWNDLFHPGGSAGALDTLEWLFSPLTCPSTGSPNWKFWPWCLLLLFMTSNTLGRPTTSTSRPGRHAR